MLTSSHLPAMNDVSTDSFATGVRFRPFSRDDARSVSPADAESRVLDDWLPQRRDHRRRLQRTIDAVEAQVALLDESGAIAAVNRAWRLSAMVQDMRDAQFGVGRNYLAMCRSAAAEGCCDAARIAEGLDGLLESQWRSFFYKYDSHSPSERRTYALLAWRMVEDGVTYVAVSHELLESRPHDLEVV